MVFFRSILALLSFTTLSAFATPTTAPIVAVGLIKRGAVAFDAALKDPYCCLDNEERHTKLVNENIYFEVRGTFFLFVNHSGLLLMGSNLRTKKRSVMDLALVAQIAFMTSTNSTPATYLIICSALFTSAKSTRHRPIIQSSKPSRANFLRKVTRELGNYMKVAFPEDEPQLVFIDSDDDDEKLASRAFGDVHDQMQAMNMNLQEAINKVQSATYLIR